MYSNILTDIYIGNFETAIICNQICSDIIIYNLKSESITQEEIENEKYKNVKYCDLSNNQDVTSVNHLKYLIYLNCSENYAITQEGILECTNVRILNVCNVPNITSVK